jgi:tetratricopeptide (TPR) repeat protein
VAATGLLVIRPETSDTTESYAIHPGVAEAGRDQAGIPFRDAADTVAAAFWTAVREHASGEAGDGTMHTGLAVRAGLAGVPYLVRQQRWANAAHLLEGAFLRDPSRANAAAMLPAIQQVTRHDPRQTGKLALVLRVLDPTAAETVMREYLDAAVAAGNYRSASVIAGRLTYLCQSSGRLAEALDIAGQKVDYTQQAGLGPWTQLADEVQRLQVLAAMGRADHVLAEVTRLRDRLATLHATPGSNEAVTPWDVREALLATGHDAAIQLARWADALDLSAAQVASQRGRNALAIEIASSRFNGYVPLLRLGRTDEALALLQDCLRTFQDARDTLAVGKTLSALADAESQRGHGEAALRLERDALRYLYLAGDVDGIAVSYHNHGNCLRRAGQPAQALASYLADALIFILMGDEQRKFFSIRAVATDLRERGTAAVLPTTIADLDRQLGHIEGTDLPGLIARLSPDPETAEHALREIIQEAQRIAESEQDPG